MSSEQPEIIRRPDKGLTISGTRTTIYAVMDYVQAHDSREDMLVGLNLTDAQLDVALAYITANREAVDAEYQHVLQLADEHRRVAEEQLREHLARTPRPPITPRRRHSMPNLSSSNVSQSASSLMRSTASQLGHRHRDHAPCGPRSGRTRPTPVAYPAGNRVDRTAGRAACHLPGRGAGGGQPRSSSLALCSGIRHASAHEQPQ